MLSSNFARLGLPGQHKDCIVSCFIVVQVIVNRWICALDELVLSACDPIVWHTMRNKLLVVCTYFSNCEIVHARVLKTQFEKYYFNWNSIPNAALKCI